MDSQRGARFTSSGVNSGHVHRISDITDVDTTGAETNDMLVWSGGAWITRPISIGIIPVKTPSAPAIYQVSGVAQYDSTRSTTSTTVWVRMTPPDTYDDGSSPVDDVDRTSTVVRWRYEDTRITPCPGVWGMIVSIGDTTTFSGVLPGYSISVQAAVMDRWGQVSAWSGTYTYLIPAITPMRQVAQWTGTLADAQTVISQISMSKSYRIIHIETDQPVRVRLYATAADASVDVDRPVETLPESTVGCWFDFVTAGGIMSSYVSPPAEGSTFAEPVIPS